MKLPYAFLTGLIFGIGIALSGMMDPAKVLNFFDIAGRWDPSLAFAMGGALVVFAALIATSSVNVIAEWMLRIAPDIGVLM